MRFDDNATLLDIARALSFVIEFVGDEDEDAFMFDDLVQSAVLHQFMVIGEATKRLSENLRNEHDHIPWRKMAGMRDRLIHGYDGVDFGIVWDTAVNEVPPLLEKIRSLIDPTVTL